jgi:hypothetical protein
MDLIYTDFSGREGWFAYAGLIVRKEGQRHQWVSGLLPIGRDCERAAALRVIRYISKWEPGPFELRTDSPHSFTSRRQRFNDDRIRVVKVDKSCLEHQFVHLLAGRVILRAQLGLKAQLNGGS